jgi:hypothetical protein
MQLQKNFLTTKPILKAKPQQLILSIQPQSPTENRLPPASIGGNISRNPPPVREKLPLRESIDYDKLTANEQAKWDAGMYGSLHLKSDKGYQYYVVRWFDPRTKALRSNSVGKTIDEAKANWRKLVLGK